MRARLPVLLMACGGMAWVALDAGAPVAAPPNPARPAGPEARQAVPAALAAPPSGPWLEQVERPLFASGRRPPVQAATPAAAEAPPPQPPPPVAASGVVLRPTGALALLRLADERTVRAMEGEEVEGWLVARIGAEGVELSRAGVVLRLPVRVPAAGGVLRH